MSAEPGPQDPDVDGEELESVELEEREDDDAAYDRFDCSSEDPEVVADAIDAAQRAVEDGECIVLPTDTVYGIGADAFSADAVQGLLDAKGRGRDMPPPVLVGDASLIRALAADVPDQARQLVDVHWPGPLTIVCRIQPSLRMDLGDTDGTIALRVPDHPLAREVLRRTGPLAVSSANRSGRPAASTCDEAVEQLEDRVAVYLDGGPVGTQALPSTIVDFTRRDDGQLLRRGALSLETLRETLPGLADVDEPAAAEPEPPVDTSETNPGTTAEATGEPTAEATGESAPDTTAETTHERTAELPGPDAFEPGPVRTEPGTPEPAAPPQPDEPRIEPEPDRA